MGRIEAALREHVDVAFSTQEGGWPIIREAADRIAELERIIRLLAYATCDVERENIAVIARSAIKD